LTDRGLLDWEMLMRLRIGAVEVFGHTDEEYRAWLERLQRYGLPQDVPSPAWTRLSVLWIAVCVEEAFARLHQEGRSDLPSLASVIYLEQAGETVAVFLSRERVGQAPLAEVQAAFAAYAERVRDDFLAICPALQTTSRLATGSGARTRHPTYHLHRSSSRHVSSQH
jgi:hypothetical protein